MAPHQLLEDAHWIGLASGSIYLKRLEKIGHGNMAVLTNARRPGQPRQRMYENRPWE
jgi:hypothetical protein